MLPKLPAKIEILNVGLGSSRGGTGGLYAKSDGTVTATVEGASAGQFRIVRIETDNVVDDPDGPHGTIKVLEVDQVVNGPGPIPVSAGQALQVAVDFTCPSDPPSAKFEATVAILGLAAPASLPVIATAALGTLEAFGPDSATMLPGTTATFDFQIFSSKGHDVATVFVFDSTSDPNFSAPDQSRTVPAQGSAGLSVPVTCKPGTPEGQHVLDFEILAQDRSQTFGFVQLDVTVTRTVDVFTNLPGDFTLLHGDDVLCELRVVVSGSPAELAASHGPVPTGLTVTPDSRFLTIDGMAFTNFDVEVNGDAPLGKLAPLPIIWTVREPEITGQLLFNIEVVAEQAVMPLPNPLSQLSQENNPKPVVCDHAVLTISNSGSWNLVAHFENQETLADVSFVFEAGLTFEDPARGRFAMTIDGGLSAAGEGPATTIGLRILGYPPSGTYQRHGTFGPFQDPTYWQSARSSSASFKMLAAFGEPDGGNIPDPPDARDPKRPSEEG